MDEEIQEHSVFTRHRSPVFTKDEIKALLNLIDKYKSIVLNKSTTASVSHAKEITWAKIAKDFNNLDFKNIRTASCLKIKFDNMKKEARKFSKNVMQVKYSEFSDITSQLVTLIREAENNTSTMEIPQDDDLVEIEKEKELTDNSDKIFPWEDSGNKQSDLSSEDCDNENEKKICRTLNFSPQECKLLLKCVRAEKYVLSKDISAKAISLKRRAWNRITESFNRVSPQKRSTKVLRTKFTNMKKLARNVSLTNYVKEFSRKREKLFDKDIKSEPLFEYNVDVESGPHVDEDYNENHDIDKNCHRNEDSHVDFVPDPLSTVLNSDSGLGSMMESHKSYSKEIAKIKIELLNYKMETAKLERKRLEDTIRAEAAERESRAIETSLRLRAARLEAVAAELKLPEAHPALHYTADEVRAQQHLHQYSHT